MTHVEEKELMRYLDARHRIYLNRRHRIRMSDGVTLRYETMAEMHKRIAPVLLDAEALRMCAIAVA